METRERKTSPLTYAFAVGVRCDLSVRRADETWPVVVMRMTIFFLTQLSDWQCSNLNVFGSRVCEGCEMRRRSNVCCVRV